MIEPRSSPPDTKGGQQPFARRALLPREHGAYAELAFSLATALALGGFSAAPMLLAAGAIAAFLAHEPALVMLGARGRRALDQSRDRAALGAAGLLAAAIVAGVAGWRQAAPAARRALLLPLTFAVILVPVIFARREKTPLGELLVALTFASASIPIALAGDAAPKAAFIAGSIWAVIFSLQTLVVRSVTGRATERLDPQRRFVVAACLSLSVVLAGWLFSLAGLLPFLAAAALAPAALVGAACALLRVHARHLRLIGWSLAGSDVLALVALVAALR